MNLWKNHQFTRFFASYVAGNIGDWFDVFALQIIFVHEWNSSAVTVSLVILFYFLPGILLSPIAGVWADRFSKRNLMLITDAIAGVLTVGLFFSASPTEALILLFIRSCFVSINAPAQQAYIKYVVTDEQLLKASSYTTVVFQLCKVIGPMLGAAVLVIASARACLLINAFSFFISTLILLSLVRDKADISTVNTDLNQHWLKDVLVGINYIKSLPLIRNTVLLVTIWFFCSLVRQAPLAVFFKHILPSKPDVLGIFMGLDGLGAVITSSLMSRKKEITQFNLYFFIGFFLIGLGILGMSFYQSVWPIALLYSFALVIGCGTGVLLVNYSYIVKKRTPQDLIGRISGSTSALQNVFLTLGTLSSGFLVTQFGLHEVYIALAVVMLILATSSLFLLIE